MPGTVDGAIRGAARRAGLTEEEYQARVAAGCKWCTGCRDWHPREHFAADGSRSDGLTASCRTFRNGEERARYQPAPSGSRRGPLPAPARDGDARQARARVNVLVRTGRIPRPGALPCVDCGHVWTADGPRHEYDHHLGYGAEHHLDVEAVCAPCHHRRGNDV